MVLKFWCVLFIFFFVITKSFLFSILYSAKINLSIIQIHSPSSIDEGRIPLKKYILLPLEMSLKKFRFISLHHHRNNRPIPITLFLKKTNSSLHTFLLLN